MSKILKENMTLTKLTEYLNRENRFEKKTRTKFTTNDVYQYVLAEHLPNYMGGNEIRRNREIKTVKLYNLYD